jgi:hypothetical protein
LWIGVAAPAVMLNWPSAQKPSHPGITYVQSRQNRSIIGAGSLAFPDLDAQVAKGFFGPNFLLTPADPAPKPEPASMGLAGLGIVALLAGAFANVGKSAHSRWFIGIVGHH